MGMKLRSDDRLTIGALARKSTDPSKPGLNLLEPSLVGSEGVSDRVVGVEHLAGFATQNGAMEGA